MALAYFEEKGVDIAILEVGMGGRLDATNVCRPLVSIITTVSLEHREFLGETLGQIASEKAGIIKPGAPLVTGVSHPAARRPIEERARALGVPIFRLGRDVWVRGRPERFSYHGLRWRFSGLATPLRGRHQMRNAALALAACEVLSERGLSLRPGEVPKGLREVCWRGRQEWHPGPPQLLLDGAHNPEAVRTLRRSLLADYRYKRLWVLMGVMREKDYGTMVRILAPLAEGFVFCRPRMERALDPHLLLAEARRVGVREGRVVEDVAEALRGLVTRAASDDLICVTGSLFTVGEAMALLEKNDLHHLRSMS
jgi:dihydrofolate synthase/folylpolyglutamate synthase